MAAIEMKQENKKYVVVSSAEILTFLHAKMREHAKSPSIADVLVELSNTMFGEKEAYRILVTEGCHDCLAPFMAVWDRYLALAVEWDKFQMDRYKRYIASGGDKHIHLIWSSYNEKDNHKGEQENSIHDDIVDYAKSKGLHAIPDDR
jgi:hypothetical protein